MKTIIILLIVLFIAISMIIGSKTISGGYEQCVVPEHKKQRYEFLKKQKFVSPGYQISHILKNSKSKSGFKTYQKLLQLFSKFVITPNYKTVFDKLNSFTNSHDSEIYKYLGSFMKKYKCSEGLDKNCSYYKYLISEYQEFLNIEHKPDLLYLDFGCGDCSKTCALSDALKIKPGNLYASDINKWGAYAEEKRLKIQKDLNLNLVLLEESKKLPFDNGKFDIVSAMMVLHHVVNLDETISELSRILKPGGILILKEHDAYNADDYMLCDIEHGIFEVAQRKNQDFFKTYYGKYFDKFEWIKKMKKHNLELKDSTYITKEVRSEIGPTRNMFLIFKKSK